MKSAGGGTASSILRVGEVLPCLIVVVDTYVSPLFPNPGFPGFGGLLEAAPRLGGNPETLSQNVRDGSGDVPRLESRLLLFRRMRSNRIAKIIAALPVWYC